MSDQSHERMLSAYFHLMNLNGASHVYRAAKQAGLLAAMQSRPSATTAELAQACGLAEAPVRLVLDTLASLQLVARDDSDRFTLTPLAHMLLAGDYQNLSDEYWAYLPQFLKTGQPLMKMDDVAQSESHYVKQAKALAWMCAPAAADAARILRIGTKRRAANILDIGAGAGVWSLTMANHDPQARVTAIDWPGVLEIAATAARHQGVGDRLTLLAGNFNEVELPADTFDLAIVANVTHLLTPPAISALLARVRRALKPAGEVVIIDVLSEQLSGAFAKALYALGLALRTEHGTVHSRSDLSRLLIQCGYESPEHYDLPATPGVFGMIVARHM